MTEGTLAASNGTDITTISFSVTTVANCNLLLVSVVWMETTLSVSGISLDSVTFNGVALTLHTTLSNSVNSELWYLLDPDIGTYTLALTWGGPGIAEGGLASAIVRGMPYLGATPENPFGVIQTTTGTGTAASLTVPECEERHPPTSPFSTGSILLDTFAVYQPGSFAVLDTTGSNNDGDLWNDNLAGGPLGVVTFSSGGSNILNGTTVYGDNVMSWSLDASRNWTYWAIEVKAPAFLGIRAGQVVEF